MKLRYCSLLCGLYRPTPKACYPYTTKVWSRFASTVLRFWRTWRNEYDRYSTLDGMESVVWTTTYSTSSGVLRRCHSLRIFQISEPGNAKTLSLIMCSRLVDHYKINKKLDNMDRPASTAAGIYALRRLQPSVTPSSMGRLTPRLTVALILQNYLYFRYFYYLCERTEYLLFVGSSGGPKY